MKVHNLCMIVIALVIGFISVACQAQRGGGQRNSRCAGFRCGWGARCELDRSQRPVCICPSNCLTTIQPVCGSDGISYRNLCEMEVAGCNRKKDIFTRYSGQCRPVQSPQYGRGNGFPNQGRGDGNGFGNGRGDGRGDGRGRFRPAIFSS